MIATNVPVVPGYHGIDQNPQFLKQKALEIVSSINQSN